MRNPLALWQICLALFLFGGWSHANDRQYGLFLIDQSESMNQPEYSPRYLRALEAITKEIESFTQEAASFDRVPFYKIVSFNSELGYAERTAWTSDRDYALDALAYLYDEKGFETSAIDSALCEAGKDLELQTSLRNLARVYLFTDSTSTLNPACDLLAVADPKELNTLQDRDLPFLELAKTTQWRVFHYQGLPAEQRVPGSETSSDLTPDIEQVVHAKLDEQPNGESDLERLAELSGGITMKINDSRDYSDTLPCALFDQDCQRSKSGSQTVWAYYNVGKNTFQIKRISSPIAYGWSGGAINIGAQSSEPVSAVRYQDRTYIFYRGNTHTNLHYAWSNDNGSTWNGGGYVQTGGPNVTTLTSPQSPTALVINGKIRLYYLQNGFSYGPIKYIDSTGVSSNGSLYWSSTTHYTGLETLSTNGTVAAVVDPINNEEVLVFGSRTTSAVSMYGRSISNPGLWSLKKSFGSITSTKLEVIHTGSELCIAFMGTNYGLYFMKESANWVPHRIGTLTTYHKPGFAYMAGKTVIVYQTSGSNIFYITSTNGGLTWSSATQAVDQTNRGIDLIAYSYDLPLSCGITGPYFGDIGNLQTFTANASYGTPPYSYQWVVNGFTVSTSSQLQYYFLSSGSNTINLTVTDANNDICTKSRVFTAFDPNGGGCGRFVICP